MLQRYLKGKDCGNCVCMSVCVNVWVIATKSNWGCVVMTTLWQPAHKFVCLWALHSEGGEKTWAQSEAVCDWSHPLVFVWCKGLWVALDWMLICVWVGKEWGGLSVCACVCVCVCVCWVSGGGSREQRCVWEKRGWTSVWERGSEGALLPSKAVLGFFTGFFFLFFYLESGLLPTKVWVCLSHCLSVLCWSYSFIR